MCPIAALPALPPPARTAAAIGIAQIFSWGGSYFLIGPLASAVAADTGWSGAWIAGGLSLAMAISGLVSPAVGRRISRLGGRRVLCASAILMAAGLAVLAAAPSLPVYLLGWAILGVSMGAGLFDPAFAALGRLYGEAARPAITQMTLWAGFSSSLCWPLTAALASTLGWRETCLVYAVLQLVVVWPLYRFGLPAEEARPLPAPTASAAGGASAERGARGRRLALGVYCATMTLALVQVTVMAVELIPLFQSRGFALAVAVGFAAIFGPAQVGGRVVEMALGRRRHPVWTLILSSAGMAIGLALLLGAPWAITAGMVIYGAACGIRSIARGTVPLALVGQADYAAMMGRLALPMLLAQAIAPNLGEALMGALGGAGLLASMVVLAGANLVLSVWLLGLARRIDPGARKEGRPSFS